MEVCRELIGNALLGLAIIQDKKLVYANDGLADIIGINLEDMLALSSDDFMSMIYPDDRNRILGTLIDGISSNKLPLRQEFRIIRKNGDIAWTDVRANFIDFQGKPAMQVALMDITSRKNAEIEANATKEEYGEILSSISDGFLALDDNLLITYFNKAAESMLGRAASDVLGCNFVDAFPEYRGSIFEDTYKWAVKEKRHISFETYFGVKPYENWYDVRVYPRKNGISVYFQVITDRKAAEETLRLSEEQYRLLFETMVQGVVYQDAKGKIISANPAAERILGLSNDEIKGKTPEICGWKAKHEDGSDFPGETHPSMIALDTGKAVKDIVMGIFNPNDMEYKWINVNAMPQFLPGEIKPYRVFSTFEDITGRKKVEDQLKTTLQRFYTILSSLYASLLLVSDEGKVEFVNQAFCDFFNLSDSPQELIGLSSQEMIETIKGAYLHPDEEVTCIMEIVNQGKPVRGQEVVMQDGRTCLRDFIPICVTGKSYGRLWHHLDITEHKHIEENTRALCHELEVHQTELEMQNEELQRVQLELAVSEEKYRDLYEFAPIGYLTLEASGKILEANLAAAAILGTDRAYLINNQFQAYLAEGSGLEFKAFRRRVMDLDIKQTAELQLRGTESDRQASAWALVEGRAIEDGINHGFRMAIIDVTERKRAEEALSNNLAVLAKSQEIGHLGNWTLDFDTGKFEASDEDYRIYGLAPGSPTILDDICNLIHPDDLDRYREYVESVRLEGRLRGLDYRIVLPDDSVHYIHALTSSVVRDLDGRVKIASGITQDITERKLVEEQLRKTLESIGDGFIAFDEDWRFIYCNASAERIIGFSREEVLGKSFWEVFPQTLGTNLEREYRLAAAGEARDFENFYEPMGRWFHNRCYSREDGGMSVYFEDITDRKQMEEALRKSEQKFRSIVESSEAGISLIDDDGNIVEWNASQEYITGLKREEVLGKPAWDIKFQLIPQEQRTQEAYNKLKSFLLRLTDKGRIALKGWLGDQEIQSKDGKRKAIHEVIFPIKTDKGYNIGVISHDITGRMETEKSLRIKDEAIESALNAMSLANPSGDLFYANESWLKLMGYEREEIAGRSLLDFLQDPKDVDEIKKQIAATGRWEGELIGRKKDGSTMDVHLSASTVKDKSDRSICIISSFVDITESKKIQRELMESENKLKAIFDLLPIGVYVVDLEGRIIEANHNFIDFMGLSLEELTQRKQWERKYFSSDGSVLPRPKDAKDSLYRNYPAGKAMLEKMPSKYLEIGMEKENGESVWASTKSVPISISNWAALVAVMDITERRKMEEELRIKDAAIEGSIAAISIASLEGKLTYVNHATLNMWGFKKEEILGKPLGLFLEDPRKFEDVADALFKIGNWSGDLVGKKKDGSTFDVHLSANIVKNAAGKPLCLIGSNLDITDRKKMERELREREERFRKIFELSPIGIQLFDVEGLLASANQASQKIMGITDTARHKRYNIFRDVLANIESQHKLMSGQIVIEGAWIKANSDKAAKKERDMLQDRKGQVYIENTITALGGDGGELEGYLCLQQDLTERKLADEAMINENERLQIIYDIWKTRVKTSDMRITDYKEE
ncbi:MAG: PAS domain S-box protein [Methanothrix sp.]|nr:PAS domain S-box protein [Methanothrix sp.]